MGRVTRRRSRQTDRRRISRNNRRRVSRRISRRKNRTRKTRKTRKTSRQMKRSKRNNRTNRQTDRRRNKRKHNNNKQRGGRQYTLKIVDRETLRPYINRRESLPLNTYVHTKYENSNKRYARAIFIRLDTKLLEKDHYVFRRQNGSEMILQLGNEEVFKQCIFERYHDAGNLEEKLVISHHSLKGCSDIDLEQYKQMLRDEKAVMMDGTYIYSGDKEYAFRERATLKGTSFAALDFNLTPPPSECPICGEIIEENLYTTGCNHTYHTFCIDQWMATCLSQEQEGSCPICRAPIT